MLIVDDIQYRVVWKRKERTTSYLYSYIINVLFIEWCFICWVKQFIKLIVDYIKSLIK
jgi:hypothetical protein